jgi:hypothetical protein
VDPKGGRNVERTRRRRIPAVATRLVAVLAVVPVTVAGAVAVGLGAGPADAAACSTTAGAGQCSVATSIAITQGTIQVLAASSLSWSYVLNGYDQWASGSATNLTGCSASAGGTTCSGGTLPMLEVIDSSGTGNGWALSAYLSSADLPSGSVLAFDGTGSATVGNSTVAPVSADPFAATVPANECDYQASGCVRATPASSCSHAPLGFTSCPTYPVTVTASSGPTSQVDLYSAAASTGEGAVCFASGSPTSQNCGGTSPDDYFNLGVPASTTSASDLTTVVNLTASSGP